MKYSFDLENYIPGKRGEKKRSREEKLERAREVIQWVSIGGSLFLFVWWTWLGGGEWVSGLLADEWMKKFPLYNYPNHPHL